tara:strand:+ start:27 stop:1001 length:975 start_codon:yes stop_codon:yes gene_type:complete
MAAIDRVVQFGKMMEGGKADINTLMNAIPAALADIHQTNAEKEEKANERAENKEWNTKIFNRQTDQINYGRDSQTNSILAGMTAEEVNAALPHFKFYTEQGQADSLAIQTAKNTTKGIVETGGENLKQLKLDIQNPNMTQEEKEKRIFDYEIFAQNNNIDLKNNQNYIGLKNDINLSKTRIELKEYLPSLLKDGVNVEQVAGLLLNPGLDAASKKRLVEQNFKPMFDANAVNAVANSIKLYQPDLSNGITGDPFMVNLLSEQLAEKAGLDMTEFDNRPVSISDYKSASSNMTSEEVLKLWRNENPTLSDDELIKQAVKAGHLIG